MVSRSHHRTMIGNEPLGVLYVEVNSSNFANAGCYSVGCQKPLFDIAIIFAANINFDTTERRAYLYFNPNVQKVLSNAIKFIRPLQAKGIKVLLSILGNHQGAGICNFPTRESAHDFAVQLRGAVELYGLDGIDFDDEYVEYGNNDTGKPNKFSFVFLLRELRTLMPDKIISLYYLGPVVFRLSYNELNAGDYLDYSWNASYSCFDPPVVPGLDKSQLAPAAVWLNYTDACFANEMATRTVEEGYGAYLYYNLPNSDINKFLSDISERLYGCKSTLCEDCLDTWPPLKSNSEEENSNQPQLPLREFNRS